MSSAPATPVGSLYVHVPFCARKCEYCAFYSEPAAGDTIHRYLAALERELELVAPSLRPCTVYFGGGTPSLLDLRQWRRLLGALERLNLLGAAEWTVECNPATVSFDKAKLWRDFGVNRVSLGVQSLDEQMLERLGRVHTREMVFQTFDLLRRSGFDNVGLDLMFAIPGQTMEHWRATLQQALALGSEHLSCYEVSYEEDTPLYAQLQANEFSVDEALAGAMYEALIEHAAAHGLEQYEVANFARRQRGTERESRGETENQSAHTIPDQHALPTWACRHNVNYWRGGFFYGLGPSAASFVNGVRTKNWSNTQLYCEQLEKGRCAIESRDELTPLQRAGEIAAFGLRLTAGWPFAQFKEATGYDLRAEWQSEMQQLAADAWGEITPDGFRLTRQGLRFADAAAEKFLR